MILGGSFGWKCYRAATQGKLTYWSGFLPISVISPFICHTSARKGTLVKDTTGLWVHLLMSPLFLILSVLCLAIGADLTGLPGTDTLNLIAGHGNPTAPPVIIYNKNYNFTFPIFARMGGRFDKSLHSNVIPLNDKEKLFPTQSNKPQDNSKQLE